jgi:hypothetical protein
MPMVESGCERTDAQQMKNVTPTYPLPARGYDLPTRREPKWKDLVSQATPTFLDVLIGMTLLLAYAGTLVLAFCFGMISAASDSPRRRSDRFVTGLLFGFGLGWFAGRTYRDGSEDQHFRR